MLTEDINLPLDGSWLGIPLTSTSTAVYNGTGEICMVRLGIASTSLGFVFDKEETLVVDETIYVRRQNVGTATYGSLGVTR